MSPESKYGLVAGFGACVWMMAEYALGLHTRHLEIWQYTDALSTLILVVAIYLMLKRRRGELPPGTILPLWRPLLSAVLASLVAACIIYVFSTIYTLWINPGWVDTVLNWKVAKWRAAEIPETEIRRQITAYRYMHSPVGRANALLVTTPLLGAIVGVFVTVWLNLRARRHVA
jgi:hypothetical protein